MQSNWTYGLFNIISFKISAFSHWFGKNDIIFKNVAASEKLYEFLSTSKIGLVPKIEYESDYRGAICINIDDSQPKIVKRHFNTLSIINIPKKLI